MKKASRLASESKMSLGEDIVDEEEFSIIKRDRAAKRTYRGHKEQYEQLKVDAESLAL